LTGYNEDDKKEDAFSFFKHMLRLEGPYMAVI
jgi:hypothetical protein